MEQIPTHIQAVATETQANISSVLSQKRGFSRTYLFALALLVVGVALGSTSLSLPLHIAFASGGAEEDGGEEVGLLAPRSIVAFYRPVTTAKPSTRGSHSAAPSVVDPRVERIEQRRARAAEQASSSSLENTLASSSSSTGRAPTVHAGVYLTGPSVGRRPFLEDTLTALGESNGDAIVFDVKGSFVYFHANAPIAEELNLKRPLYELPDILAFAHERGIYTIGRFIAIKDEGFTTAMPEARMRNPKTGTVLSYNWIDPMHGAAIDYNMQVLCELASSGIDEVNLDYIRFSTADVGALRILSGQEKADRVEVFLRAARDTINRCGPQTKLGISTYAILGWSYQTNLETLGQDVVRFAPLVDIISPMAYPATFAANAYYNPAKHPVSRMYYLVFRTIQGYAELLGPDHAHKLRPWIQGYGVTVKNMQDQMRAVYDAGACGFTVWNANNAYAPTYAAMKTREVPERCKVP
ncbi:MAG: putative glycoside hydrolase [Candidatus Peregrinibacteria bacterium]|nr:putative glycoside hydrolase [Candidatus Peregrinibacteria bacterium]